jgi:hypothetical protein
MTTGVPLTAEAAALAVGGAVVDTGRPVELVDDAGTPVVEVVSATTWQEGGGGRVATQSAWFDTWLLALEVRNFAPPRPATTRSAITTAYSTPVAPASPRPRRSIAVDPMLTPLCSPAANRRVRRVFDRAGWPT